MKTRLLLIGLVAGLSYMSVFATNPTIFDGDMNASDRIQRKFFDAGFNIANGGYEGWFCTDARFCGTSAPNAHIAHIDNIITSKNIKITNVSAPHTGLTAKDHWPILADIIITWSNK